MLLTFIKITKYISTFPVIGKVINPKISILVNFAMTVVNSGNSNCVFT